MFGQQTQNVNQLALANPRLKAPVAGLIGRVLGRHLGPLRAASANLVYTVQHCSHIVPGTATIVLTPRRTLGQLRDFQLFVRQIPTECHNNPRRRLEQMPFAEFKLQKCL